MHLIMRRLNWTSISSTVPHYDKCSQKVVSEVHLLKIVPIKNGTFPYPKTFTCPKRWVDGLLAKLLKSQRHSSDTPLHHYNH